MMNEGSWHKLGNIQPKLKTSKHHCLMFNVYLPSMYLISLF